jgi:hypothetical protein
VPIEKAFAINAQPQTIYDALTRDLREADAHRGDTFEILREDPPRSIDLRVTIGGVSCWLTYRLEPRGDHTEVIGVLTPFGVRYMFFKFVTLGLRDQGFEIALVEGLANLKAEVEAEDVLPA